MGKLTDLNSIPQAGRAAASFSRTIGWFAGTYAVSSVGFLACQALAGHILGLSQYAVFASITTASVVLGQLGTFGLHRSGLRMMARSGDPDSDEVSTQYAGVRVVALVALPVLALVWGAVALPVFSASAPSMLIALAVALCVAALTHCLAFTTVAAGFLRGGGRIEVASLLDGRSGGAVMVVVQAAALVVLSGDHSQLRLEHCLIAMGLGAIPAGLFAWWSLLSARRPRERRRHSMADIFAVIREGSTFAGIQAAGMLNAQVETGIAAVLLSRPDASGFAAAQRIALLVVLPLNAAQTVFAPTLSRLAARGRRGDLARLLAAINTVTAALCLIASVLLAIFSNPVLGHIFGSGFSASAALLVVLLLGPLGLAALGMCSVALSMAGHESVVWRVQGSTVVVRTVSGVSCAALWGEQGLAWSASVVTVLSCVAIAMICKQRLEVRRLFAVQPKQLLAIGKM